MAEGGVQVYVDYSKVRLRLQNMPEAVRDELLDVVQVLDVELVATASALAPEKSGFLKQHIKGSVSNTEKHITGRARVRAPYAAILEWGGTIPAHDIMPDTAQALAFLMDGEQVLAKLVHHPATTIQARYFMHDALAAMSGEIVRGLEEAVDRGIAKGAD
jgi:hypothetical protein